jgi:hypothetical protein
MWPLVGRDIGGESASPVRPDKSDELVSRTGVHSIDWLGSFAGLRQRQTVTFGVRSWTEFGGGGMLSG